MFVARVQSMGKKCCKKIATTKDRLKVLSTMGQIIYSKACPMDHDHVLWVQLQINIMATKYPNAS
jgi:hypothetical protein